VFVRMNLFAFEDGNPGEVTGEEEMVCGVKGTSLASGLVDATILVFLPVRMRWRCLL
jgi:hypothetical protein